MRKAYQTDLSDAEWFYVEPHLPTPKATPKAPGRPRLHTPREILDAIFYIVRSGCAWRLLPHDFPPWKTVLHYFRRWRIDGTWEKIHTALRGCVRVRKKRDPEPSAGVVDNQSVKSTGAGGDQRGYDGGKKVKGRKRHLLVDTEGLVLQATIHSAKVMDYEGIKILLEGADETFPRLSHLWLDGGYRGEGKGKDWVEKTLGWSVDLVERPKKPASKEVLMTWARELAKEGVALEWQKFMPQQGFVVLSRRWVVERTFSWIDQNRKMSKDYERLPESSEAFIYVAMSRLMARRLARTWDFSDSFRKQILGSSEPPTRLAAF